MTGADVRGHIWTTVETTVGTMCACMPILRPIFDRSRRTGASQQSDTGPNRYARFPNDRDFEAEDRQSHKLQKFASQTTTVVGSKAYLAPTSGLHIPETAFLT